MGLNIDEQKAVERFRSTVVEPSMTKLVIVDFWAEWCGPCKALTPVLEKVAAAYAERGVVLAKINVDEERFIAAQFQIRTIPTVYAMFQGQPIADLTNARTESQLSQMLDQLLAQLPVEGGAAGAPGAVSPEEIAQYVAMAEQILTDGDAQRAAGIFAQVVDMAPDNAAAHAGHARALLAAGEPELARQALDVAMQNEALAKQPAITQARQALDLAANAVDDGELTRLRAAAESDPNDHAAALAYAEAAFASGERDAAADTLLASIAIDRDWNEGAARTKLLQIFEAVGLEDPWVAATRRRLSRILFG